jgi:hypothetical protein
LKTLPGVLTGVATVVGAVVSIIALVGNDSGNGTSASPTPPASSGPLLTATTTASPPPQRSTTPLPTVGAGPAGSATYADLEVGDGDYVDIDAGSSSARPTRDEEIWVEFGRVSFYYGTTSGAELARLFRRTVVAIVADAKVSYSGCEHASNVETDGVVVLDEDVADDESLCVSTSRGAWAGLKVIPQSSDSAPSNRVAFNVWLFQH